MEGQTVFDLQSIDGVSTANNKGWGELMAYVCAALGIASNNEVLFDDMAFTFHSTNTI